MVSNTIPHQMQPELLGKVADATTGARQYRMNQKHPVVTESTYSKNDRNTSKGYRYHLLKDSVWPKLAHGTTKL